MRECASVASIDVRWAIPDTAPVRFRTRRHKQTKWNGGVASCVGDFLRICGRIALEHE